MSPKTPRGLAMYGAPQEIAEAVAAGRHRDVIGGAWDEIGELQIAFLRAQGLTRQSRLLDIGCGSLRLGVHAVAYLNPGNYWGTDLHPVLLDAGYKEELRPRGLADRLPRAQLVEDSEFLFPGVPASIDFAIATSLFTHLPLNHLRLCLHRLEAHLASSCTFFFSVFFAANARSLTGDVLQQPGGRVTQSHSDPYHYLAEDMHYAARHTGWDIDVLGDWGHPRGQRMVKATLTRAER